MEFENDDNETIVGKMNESETAISNPEVTIYLWGQLIAIKFFLI